MDFDDVEEKVERLSNAKPTSISGTVGFIIGMVLMLLLCGTYISINKGFSNFVSYITDREPEIDSMYVSGKLEDVGRLTTQKLNYNGLIYYSSGHIPWINKTAFYMYYQASMTASIDVEKIVVKVTRDEVKVRIPHAEVDEPNINPSSIKYIDSKNALFVDEKEDVSKALAAAKADVLENADTSQLVKNAEENAIILIEDLLSDIVGNRSLDIRVE